MLDSCPAAPCQDALAASFKASSRQEVKAALDTLLEQLHDPFTRVLVPEDARTFYNEQEGKVGWLGVQPVARQRSWQRPSARMASLQL